MDSAGDQTEVADADTHSDGAAGREGRGANVISLFVNMSRRDRLPVETMRMFCVYSELMCQLYGLSTAEGVRH